MTKLIKSDERVAAKPVLTLKKENIQQLKVRTDLKGGAMSRLAAGPCSGCHCLAR